MMSVLFVGLLCLCLLVIPTSQDNQDNQDANQAVTIIHQTFTTTQSGDGTYYGGQTGGNCGFGSTFPNFVTGTNPVVTKVAMNGVQYPGNDKSQACGMCVSIKGTGTGSGATPVSTKAFTAFVHDDCPGCKNGDIDIVNPTGDGRWQINWISVRCPVGSEKLKYKFQGSNPYYLKVQVMSHALPLKSVQFVSSSGTVYTATRTNDNFWLSPGNLPTPVVFPLKVNVIATSGETVTDVIPKLGSDTDILAGTNNVQFAGTSGAVLDDTAGDTTNALDTNAVIGISVGCAVAFVVIVVVIVVLLKRKQHTLEMEIA